MMDTCKPSAGEAESGRFNQQAPGTSERSYLKKMTSHVALQVKALAAQA